MMNALESRLHSRISLGGPLSFAEFMQAALYDPENGYYGSGRARIGRAGDFYTSVSAGPLFGRMLARQLAQMWATLDCPLTWTLVEQGAHTGQLAIDVLEALQKQDPACFEATQLFIVEPLSGYQELQRRQLQSFEGRVHWVAELESLPSFTGVFYSNELLDAFPVHRLQRLGEAWRELRVASEGNSFAWTLCPIENPALARTAAALPPVPEGFCMEAGLLYAPWLQQLGARLERGWMLAFDYGMSADELAAPHRKDGTLTAYRNHQRQPDPLISAGELDLTAHVNFTALALDSLKAGWTLAGYTDQHRFFTGLAPLHFQDALGEITSAEQKERLAFRTLSHPQMMGAQFKVFCLSRRIPDSVGLAGFTFAREARFTLGLPPV